MGFGMGVVFCYDDLARRMKENGLWVEELASFRCSKSIVFAFLALQIT